mgnify:CR=1 FL=1
MIHHFHGTSILQPRQTGHLTSNAFLSRSPQSPPIESRASFHLPVRLYIRQNRTFTGISKDGGNSTPLIIIDDVIQLGTNGQPSMEQFNMLDPSEVESITVLR